MRGYTPLQRRIIRIIVVAPSIILTALAAGSYALPRQDQP